MFDTEKKKRIAPATAILAVALALALPVLGMTLAPPEAHAAQGAAAQEPAKAKKVTSSKSRKSLKKAKVAIKTKDANLVYTGKSVKPKVTVTYKGKKLKKGRDYKLSYKDNVNVGTAKLLVTGKGRYKGTKTVKYSVNPFRAARGTSVGQKLADGMTMKMTSAPKLKSGNLANARFLITYNGMTLEQGKDYVVSHANLFPDYDAMDLSKKPLSDWLGSADCPYLTTTYIDFKGNYTGSLRRDCKVQHVGSGNALQAARAA